MEISLRKGNSYSIITNYVSGGQNISRYFELIITVTGVSDDAVTFSAALYHRVSGPSSPSTKYRVGIYTVMCDSIVVMNSNSPRSDVRANELLQSGGFGRTNMSSGIKSINIYVAGGLMYDYTTDAQVTEIAYLNYNLLSIGNSVVKKFYLNNVKINSIMNNGHKVFSDNKSQSFMKIQTSQGYKTYSFELGMNWVEWADSVYNVDGFTLTQGYDVSNYTLLVPVSLSPDGKRYLLRTDDGYFTLADFEAVDIESNRAYTIERDIGAGGPGVDVDPIEPK